MTKKERHERLRERASEAIRNMYHNATPRYPLLEDDEAETFQAWFNDAATFELEYIQDGGAYGSDYHATLSAPCNAGKYKSKAAQEYYVRCGMRKMRVERAKFAPWENIHEYGTLYSYGRGGRTIAPDSLVQMRGGSSFSLRESLPDEMSIEACVDLIRTLESFNTYVENWNRNVPELWEEEKSFRLETAQNDFPNENLKDFERVNV